MDNEAASSVSEGALYHKATRIPVPNPTTNIHVEEEGETLWTMSRKKKLVLFCLTMGSMKCFLCLGLLSPIYPGEAKSRGIDLFATSWVFSVYSLTQVITAPLFGKAIAIVGARVLYISGAFITASCVILFGFLAMLPRDEGPALFITFSYILRIVMALGGTAWLTSGFAIAMSTFHHNAGTVFGLLETAMGIGSVLGPVLSGVLDQAGGFFLPFLLLGGLSYLLIPMYICLLDSTKERKESASMLSILRTPWSFVLFLVIVVAAIMSYILEPLLQIHLEEQFGIGPVQVGFALFLMNGGYSISCSVVGVIVDNIKDSRCLCVIGFGFSLLAFFFLGPSPLSSLVQYKALWLNLMCIGLVGLASALAVIPTYSLLTIAARKSGMPDNLSTHGAVSGLWVSAFTMGESVGPVTGGWLVVNYGFDWATTGCAFLALGMIIVLVPFIVYDKCCLKTRNEERLSLLE